MNLHRILLSAAFLLFATSLMAQFDPDSLFNTISKEFEDEFQDFAKKNEETFNQFVENNDKAFEELLKTAWKEYTPKPAKPVPEKPKPVEPPKVKPADIKNNEPDLIPIAPVKPEEKKTPVKKPNVPGIQKTEPETFPVNSATVSFYNTEVRFNYDKDFVKNVSPTITKDVFVDYWKKMVKTNHYTFINNMLAYKDRLGLNDWGYMELLRKAATQIAPSDKNAQNLFVWFMMIKSRYKVKIGFNQNHVFLMAASNQTLYSRTYFTFDNIKYYLMDKREGKLYTYDKDYPDAKIILDMNLNQPLNLAKNLKKRHINVFFNNVDYEFDVEYNQNHIDFFDDYPSGEIKIYFDAALTPETKASLIENLKPAVADMSETDAVNFLLRLMHRAFEYKTDGDQFNREKFFFGDELFHYPYCDCEDRSVLFAWLVGELLNLEVVGLEYPGHMATAVNLIETEGADYFMYEGKRFTVCDPTYMGAQLGMCMPQFLGEKGKVIPLRNRKAHLLARKKIWEKVYNAGGYHGSVERDIAFDKDGNAVVTGYFTGNAIFENQTLTTPDGKNEAFIAKYDKTGNVVWAKQTAGSGNNTGSYIELDENGNIYVTGTYESGIKIGNTELTSERPLDIFVIKLNSNGEPVWANKVNVAEGDSPGDNIYLAGYDSNGKHISSFLFNENEHFNNYGIRLTPDGNCLVTVSYPTSSQGEAMALNKTIESSASFNHSNVWKAEYDRLLANNYEQSIAGLFAFIKTIKVNGSSVSGKTIIEALDRYNPDFSKKSPGIYNNISKIEMLKNSGGIIAMQTVNQQDIEFAELKLKHNTRFKVTTYQGGNAQITIISGASVGQAVIRFDLNFVKMFKTTGDLIFDYDIQHSQKKLNLKKDILD